MTFRKPPFRDPKTFWQPGMTTGFSTLAMAMTRPYGSLMVVPQFLEMMIILLKCARFSGKFRHGSCHSNMNLLFRDPISGLGKIYTPTTKMGSSPLFEWKSPGVSTVTSDLIVRRRVSAQCWLVDEDCIFGTVPGRKRQGATCHGQKWREIIISLIMWTLD